MLRLARFPFPVRSAQPLTGAVFVLLALLAGAASAPCAAAAQEYGPTEGEYLYNVTTLRAAPGQYAEFVAALEQSFDLLVDAGEPRPLWFRHSQGDQWDFMVLYPMGSFEQYWSPDRARRRAETLQSPHGTMVMGRLSALTAFQEEWFAHSVDRAEMARRFEGTGLFHVEMFVALSGKRDELIGQRRMENDYYRALNRQLNLIFTRAGGANWDAMTIGFYESLGAYAAAGVAYSEEEQDRAARTAGFDGVGDISPYLRSLLAGHRDTLGVPYR
jgi:hypothetical protein